MGSFLSRLLRLFGCHPADNHDSTLDASADSGDEQPSELPGEPNPLRSRSAFHVPAISALIIGIDNYRNAHFQKLRGAVADAKAFELYLRDDLRVSKTRIRTLFNGEATRKAIIKAFGDLEADSHIKKDDPIVIYFAGHGGELPTPPGWGSQEKVQCILPQDFKDPKVGPIPDRTIGALIEKIAKVKGDNIVVIFDCCHSGSGTRDNEYIARKVDLKSNIPETLDEDIWGNRAGAISNGFAYHGLRSHVLLAACSEKEFAYEQEGYGRFTKALLKKLRERAGDELTYEEVLDDIHLERQTPQCEGVNRSRVVFSTTVPAGRRVFYSARVDANKYVIGAGSAHGISDGAEFTLYRGRNVKLGVVTVNNTSSIDGFQTTVTSSKLLRGVSLAKLTRIGKLPLYLSRGGKQCSVLERALQQICRQGTSAQTFRVVGNAEEAKLELTMENDQVIFKIIDERVKTYGLKELPYRVGRDSLPHVLGSAARFFWYLDLKNPNSGLSTNNNVPVDFYLLKRVHDEYGLPIYSPVQPGFCRKVGNSHIIEFVVEPDGHYGIEIKNNTPRGLYFNAFLFNYSSFGISSYYTQTAAGNPEVPLKRGGTFTIGYGSGGCSPFSYTLEEGQNIDVSCLKIFFASRPIDLSDVKQDPAFSNVSLQPRAGNPDSELHSALDIEFTIQIPVVQRRKVPSASTLPNIFTPTRYVSQFSDTNALYAHPTIPYARY